jgi:hypothetical protein
MAEVKSSQDMHTMTVTQLKSELLSINHPSFVFDNATELQSALRLPARANSKAPQTTTAPQQTPPT